MINNFKFLILIIFAINFSNCKQNFIKSKYPDSVVKAGIQTLYDSCKWVIYSSDYKIDDIICYNYDNDKYTKCDSLNFVSLDLKFDTLIIRSDTTIFVFNFYMKNKFDFCKSKHGVINKIIKIKGDSIFYRLSSSKGYNDEFLELTRDINVGD